MIFNSWMLHSKHTIKKEPITFQIIKLEVAIVFTVATKSILCSKLTSCRLRLQRNFWSKATAIILQLLFYLGQANGIPTFTFSIRDTFNDFEPCTKSIIFRCLEFVSLFSDCILASDSTSWADVIGYFIDHPLKFETQWAMRAVPPAIFFCPWCKTCKNKMLTFFWATHFISWLDLLLHL